MCCLKRIMAVLCTVLCCLPCFTIPWRIAKDKKEGLIGPDGYYIHADSLEKIAEEG